MNVYVRSKQTRPVCTNLERTLRQRQHDAASQQRQPARQAIGCTGHLHQREHEHDGQQRADGLEPGIEEDHVLIRGAECDYLRSGRVGSGQWHEIDTPG